MNQILLNLPEEILTPRLILRPYKEGDGNEYYQLLNSNRKHLEHAVDELKKFANEEDAEIFTRNLMVDWIGRKRFVLSILDNANENFIGQIWIEPIEWKNRIFEIGYFINKNSEGKGMVTESVQYSIKFMFDYLDATKVEIHTDLTNTKSQAVAERCNFKKEAQIRNRVSLNNGETTDRLYYGLLREEFTSETYEFLSK